MSQSDTLVAAPAASGTDGFTDGITDGFSDGRSLVFRIAGRVYACDVAAVREVVPLARLTRLAGAPVLRAPCRRCPPTPRPCR